MKFKCLLVTVFLAVCANANAEWFLRGTHTVPAWTPSQLVATGAGTNTVQLTNVVFAAAGSVKFDRYGDWFENYGVGGRSGTNIPVAAGTWDIKFFTDTKNWSITPSVSAAVAYHIRGTFNSWAEGTLMTRVDSSAIYTSCINFVGGDTNGGPRFKIDPNGGWVDAVPAADFNVLPGWVKVTFDSASKSISVAQSLASNCGATASSSSVASSAAASSVANSSANSSAVSSSSSSAVSSFARSYNTLNLRTSSNSWGSQPMTLIANNVWQGQTSTLRSSANLFKFDVYGNWSLNFGENQPNQGIADQGGANITVAGCYNFDCTSVNVRFKDTTREYALCYNSQYHPDTGTTALCSL